MTNRHSQIIVALKHDTREDDVQDIIALIRQIGAVADAQPGPVASIADVERMRARRALRDQLVENIYHVLMR